MGNQHANNTPVFFIRDPMKFPDLIHSQERLPGAGMRSNNMQWDFWTLPPESAHQVIWFMGDRGTPRTYRNMNGYGSSTYMWENAAARDGVARVALVRQHILDAWARRAAGAAVYAESKHAMTKPAAHSEVSDAARCSETMIAGGARFLYTGTREDRLR